MNAIVAVVVKVSEYNSMYKTLLTFGCSWSCPVDLNVDNAGQEVKEHQVWGYLLSEALRCQTYHNLAIQGSGIDRAFLQLSNFVKNFKVDLDRSLAVFQLTSPDRKCLLLDHGNSVVDLRNSNGDKLSQDYYKYFYSKANHNFEMHKNILSLQALCRCYGIQDYYIRGWDLMNLDQPGIDQSRIYSQSFVELFDSHGSRNQYLLNCGHPNAAGHALVAKTLYSWINKNH